IGSQGEPDEWLRERAKDGINKFSGQAFDQSHWADFARALFYVEGSFNDARAYEKLKAKLEAVDQQFGVPGSRVYYMSIPPTMVETSVGHLKQMGLISAPRDPRSF